MGSLLDQLKGKMAKPGKGAKAGGSRAKKRGASPVSKTRYLKSRSKDRPRVASRQRGARSRSRT